MKFIGRDKWPYFAVFRDTGTRQPVVVSGFIGYDNILQRVFLTQSSAASGN